MERPGGLGGSQEAAARDRADLKKQLAQAAAQTRVEELRDATRHGQQRTPPSSPQKAPRPSPDKKKHGRRRKQGPGALQTFSSPGAASLQEALDEDDDADPTGQMQVEQEGRATTSEGGLRAEDAEARDHDGDHAIEEAPPADAAPAAAPAAASVWCDDDRKVLQALRNGGKKHSLSLARLRRAAERHGLTIKGKTDTTKLKNALEAAEPASSSSDDEDGIVPGARVMTPTHGAGVVLEGLSGHGRPRVRLDEAFLPRGEHIHKSELAIPKAQLTRLAPGDVGYEAPSTTGAAGSGTAAVHALKVKTVLEDPSQHALGFAAPKEVVARRGTPTLVVPRPLMTFGDADTALGQAADDAHRSLREHKSLLDSLEKTLDQKKAEAEDFGRREEDRKEAHIKAARDAYEAEAAKGQQLDDAFAEASRALDAASFRLCPALAGSITGVVDPLREEESTCLALRRRVDAQLEHSESAAAKMLGKIKEPVRGRVQYDAAPHHGTPPRGVLALQCPRGECRARYWFKFKEIYDDVMREGRKEFRCKGCGFARTITRGDFGDRRAREDEMDDELERWVVDFE